MVKHQQHDSQGAPLVGVRKGGGGVAIGRSRGDRITKIHAIVDVRGRPIAIEVTPDDRHDVRIAAALISAGPRGPELCVRAGC